MWTATQSGGLLEDRGVLYVNAVASFDPSYPSNSEGISDEVSAFQASDGKPIWHQSFGPTSLSNFVGAYGMQLDGQQVYLVPLSNQYPAYGHVASVPMFAFRASDGTLLWQDPLPARKFSLVALRGILYLFAGTNRFFDDGVLKAVRETDGALLWSQSVQEAGMIMGSDALYPGTAGNTDYPCARKGGVQLEKRQISTGTLIWHQQLDPAPDPALPLRSLLGISGSLLALLGLLLYVLSMRSQPQSQSLSPLPGGPARAILSASIRPRVENKAWLLLTLLGLMLLCVGLVMAQGTP
jgi:outer membrane protein assembly factor BamB